MSRRTQRRLSRTSNRKRRQTFFDELRSFAYKRVRLCDNEAALRIDVARRAGDVNLALPRPLADREIEKTVDRISKWTWRNLLQLDGYWDRNGKRQLRHRGAAHLNPIPSSAVGGIRTLLISRWKSSGALATAAIKRERTSSRILAAIEKLRSGGGAPSISEIAAAAEISPRTVYRYLAFIRARPAPPPTDSVYPPNGTDEPSGSSSSEPQTLSLASVAGGTRR